MELIYSEKLRMNAAKYARYRLRLDERPNILHLTFIPGILLLLSIMLPMLATILITISAFLLAIYPVSAAISLMEYKRHFHRYFEDADPEVWFNGEFVGFVSSKKQFQVPWEKIVLYSESEETIGVHVGRWIGVFFSVEKLRSEERHNQLLELCNQHAPINPSPEGVSAIRAWTKSFRDYSEDDGVNKYVEPEGTTPGNGSS